MRPFSEINSGERQAASTCYEAFVVSSRMFGDRPFLNAQSRGGEVELSYAEAATAIDSLRLSYARPGYGPGSKVALVLGNTVEFYFCIFSPSMPAGRVPFLFMRIFPMPKRGISSNTAR